MRQTDTTKIVGIDFFCGAGGLTRGLLNAGVSVKAGIDVDKHCKFPYEENNAPAIFMDVNVAETDRVMDSLSSIDRSKPLLLAGCAPCQPFSQYRRGGEQSAREQWGLLLSFLDVIEAIKPEFVAIENVPHLQHKDVFAEVLRKLDRARDGNYWIDHGVVNAMDFGTPQHRKRLILLASNVAPISIPKPKLSSRSCSTVRHAIQQLPKIEAGRADVNDPIHRSSGLSPLNMKRMRASKAGGSWRDWDESLIAECHKKSSGKTFPGVYGRMEWDKPSPALTTQCFGFGNGRFGHPEQDRAISLREAALLQGFPPDYEFVKEGDPIHMSVVGRMIGNAVPVQLGEAIAEAVIDSWNRPRREKSH